MFLLMLFPKKKRRQQQKKKRIFLLVVFYNVAPTKHPFYVSIDTSSSSMDGSYTVSYGGMQIALSISTYGSLWLVAFLLLLLIKTGECTVWLQKVGKCRICIHSAQIFNKKYLEENISIALRGWTGSQFYFQSKDAPQYLETKREGSNRDEHPPRCYPHSPTNYPNNFPK